LEHLGLVALLGGLLRASFIDGDRSGGDRGGEEREAGAQAERRRGGEEEAEAELGLGHGAELRKRGERLERGKDGSCWLVLFFFGRIVFVRGVEGGRVIVCVRWA
jgi:hypothetical protein